MLTISYVGKKLRPSLSPPYLDLTPNLTVSCSAPCDAAARLDVYLVWEMCNIHNGSERLHI